MTQELKFQTDISKPFGFYSPHDGYRLLDPSSVMAGGRLEDASLVEKYSINLGASSLIFAIDIVYCVFHSYMRRFSFIVVVKIKVLLENLRKKSLLRVHQFLKIK